MRFFILLLTLSLACHAQYTARVSSAPTQTDLPAIASWVALFEGNRQAAVADGTAISTLTDSSGNARNATQTGGARPVYKVAANGINSQPVIRFASASSQWMKTAAGGASLTGDFYMCAVVKFTTVAAIQQVLCWGDDQTGKRRAMLYFGGSTFRTTFNGQSADIAGGGPGNGAGTALFFEIVRSGTSIKIYQNGVQTASGNPSLNAYTSAAIHLGTNNGEASEFLNGDLAMTGFIGSAPNSMTLSRIRGYVREVYGISFPAGAANGFGATYSLTGTATSSGLFDAGSTAGQAGILDRQVVLFSRGRGVGHLFQVDDGVIGPAVFQNLNSGGYSAPDFIDASVGSYAAGSGTIVAPFGCALGWGNIGCTPAIFDGVSYWEAYDSSGSGSHRTHRIIQTAAGLNFRRIEVNASSGDIIFYRRDNAYPAETEIMRIKSNGHVNFSNVPTSASGLASGDVYSNAGILTLVP